MQNTCSNKKEFNRKIMKHWIEKKIRFWFLFQYFTHQWSKSAKIKFPSNTPYYPWCLHIMRILAFFGFLHRLYNKKKISCFEWKAGFCLNDYKTSKNNLKFWNSFLIYNLLRILIQKIFRRSNIYKKTIKNN